jgi:hypothetical protein
MSEFSPEQIQAITQQLKALPAGAADAIVLAAKSAVDELSQKLGQVVQYMKRTDNAGDVSNMQNKDKAQKVISNAEAQRMLTDLVGVVRAAPAASASVSSSLPTHTT